MAKSNNTKTNNTNTNTNTNKKENKTMVVMNEANNETKRTAAKVAAAAKKAENAKKAEEAAKKAAEEANARASIETAIDRRLKFKKAITDAFAHDVYGTFDFDKLKGRKVMEVFNDPTTRKVITEYYKLCDEVKEYTEKYPNAVKAVCAEKMAAIKQQQEIDKAMATLKKLGVNVTVNTGKEDK